MSEWKWKLNLITEKNWCEAWADQGLTEWKPAKKTKNGWMWRARPKAEVLHRYLEHGYLYYARRSWPLFDIEKEAAAGRLLGPPLSTEHLAKMYELALCHNED